MAGGEVSFPSSEGQSSYKSVDAGYAVRLMREIGKVLSEKQVEILHGRFGDDVKAAGELYRSLVDDDEDDDEKKDDGVKDEDLKGSTEPIAYRDEFWDKEERTWRLEERKKGSETGKGLDGAVLVVRQRFTEKMMPCQTFVDIRGPKLMSIMRNIYRDAEGITLAGDVVTLEPDYFFWARHHLAAARELALSSSDSSCVPEIDVALTFIKQYWPQNKADEMIAKGVISFDQLWAIFPPNTLVVGRHVLDDVRVYCVKHHMVYKAQDGVVRRRLTTQYGEYDGKFVGLAREYLQIPSYPGSVPIEQLPFVPLHMHSKRDEIWERILARTKKQFTLFEHQFQLQEHHGLGLIQFRDNNYEWVTPQRYEFTGRVMVDPARMARAEPEMLVPKLSSLSRQPNVQISRSSPDGKLLKIEDILGASDGNTESVDKVAGGKMHDYKSMREDSYSEVWEMEESMKNAADGGKKYMLTYEDLSEDQLILFSGLVFGYSLADGRWGAFSVNNVSNVEWNHGAFESLVMEPELKELVCGLIKSHHQATTDSDDFVRGKGKGLIGLLFGKPGLGKTLTAEAIAETAETPLFMISSGTLGHQADKISEKLTTMLDLATHWRAVLLLDEADVFLTCRRDNDLERNAIVSVFLRQLEYYQGILIMTTNRADSIDSAFQSRIHFCYQYPDLDKAARSRIWNTFLSRSEAAAFPKVSVSSADIEELAYLDLNGREIKNTHSIAVKLAAVSETRTLTKDGILKAIRMLQNFGPVGKH